MSKENGHYYLPNGDPYHFVEKKDGSGKRPTTIADARKVGALPSVTTILQVLDKPALTDWKIRMAVTAIVTAPSLPNEGLDDKIVRVLDTERQQDQESEIAKDMGTMLHDALECYFTGREVSEDLRSWISDVVADVCTRGQLVCAEKVLVGDGYAGKVDLILEAPDHWLMIDWKTTKKLPQKGAWPEHVLQLSGAYAPAFYKTLAKMGPTNHLDKPIHCCNVYISTLEKGKYVICHHDHIWEKVYNSGFKPLLEFWCYWKNYTPSLWASNSKT